MRLVIQRVTQAKVCGDGRVIAAIGPGVCVFLAVKRGDREKDAEYLAEKVARLRIFEDEKRRMNRSLEELGGEALVISEFTLYGDCRQGRRPSFSHASPWDEAERLYGHFIARLGSLGINVKCGQFRSAMQVHLVNDGPVTLILDSSS
jgi:D-tyrosyl-tRNA(Tyr) deacylase